FVLGDGYVYQPVATGLADGGRASYPFNLASAGNYLVQAIVDAPVAAQRSFFVNVDAEPQEPYMAWRIPITMDFQAANVSWQGNGNCLNPQIVPAVFSLSAGNHQLIIRGRDANAKLDRISILSLPSVTTLAATGVGDTYATLNGNVNPAGTATTAYFQYGPTTNYGKVTALIDSGQGTAPISISGLADGL